MMPTPDDTTNVLRKKILPAELEQLRNALKQLRPEPVSSAELKTVLAADIRMLIQHGVSMERINETLAPYASHITQAFYETLGRPPRISRERSSRSNGAPSAALSSDGMEKDGAETSEAGNPAATTSVSDSTKAPEAVETEKQVETAALEYQDQPPEAPAVKPDRSIRPMDWDSLLRPKRSARTTGRSTQQR